MAKHVLVVMTNAWKERHEELNRWYDEVHVPDLLKVPGVVSAQRFEAGPAVLSTTSASPYRYLALYEIEADSAEDAMHALEGAMPSMALTKAIDINDVVAYCYTARSEPVRAAATAAATAAA